MTTRDKAGTRKPKDDVVKEILTDGRIVTMSKKEAAKWRKKIKTKIRTEEANRG